MKQIASNIDFADEITFSNAIQFIYRGGSIINGIYQRINENSFLLEALSSYYEEIPENHPFKTFVIIDIEDYCLFEVVAEKISISKKQILCS